MFRADHSEKCYHHSNKCRIISPTCFVFLRGVNRCRYGTQEIQITSRFTFPSWSSFSSGRIPILCLPRYIRRLYHTARACLKRRPEVVQSKTVLRGPSRAQLGVGESCISSHILKIASCSVQPLQLQSESKRKLIKSHNRINDNRSLIHNQSNYDKTSSARMHDTRTVTHEALAQNVSKYFITQLSKNKIDDAHLTNLAPFFRARGRAQWLSYHCLKGIASITTMAFFTRVLVRTNSLFEALYTTSMIRVLREIPS